MSLFHRLVPAGLLVVAVLLSAAPASADQFNNATLTVSPNPTVFTDSNAYFTFTGCGYDPSTGVVIVVDGPEQQSFFGGPTDTSGCIDIVENGFVTVPGTYNATSNQDYQRGQTIHRQLRASATLTVTAS